MAREDYLSYYVRLKKGNNVTVQFTDGQWTKTVTPKNHEDGVRVSFEGYQRLQHDPRIELIREVIQTGAEELVVDEKIHESMIASYEDQLRYERTKISNRDRIIRRLNKKIEDLKSDLSNPDVRLAYEALFRIPWQKRVKFIESMDTVDALKKYIKLVMDKPKDERHKIDTDTVNAARLKIAELEGTIKKLEDVVEEKEDEKDLVDFDQLLKEIEMNDDSEEE